MSYLQEYKLTLECATPIFIGAADSQVLNKTQYLYAREKNRVYFLKEHAWIDFLAKSNLFDKFFVAVQTGQMRDLYTWLGNQGISFEAMKPFIKGVAIVPTQEKNNLNELINFVKDGYGDAYVPGSSIKGALRTAIIAHKIEKNKNYLQNKYWPEIKEALSRADKNLAKRKLNELESELLHKLEIENNKGRLTSKDNAICSSLKGLQVSDAKLTKPVATVILQKKDWVFSKIKGDKDNSISLYRECLQAKTCLDFTITFDTRILATLGLSNISELLAWQQEFTYRALTLNLKDFKNRKSELATNQISANIILGGGSGFLSKTIVYNLAPSEKEARDTIAAFLDRTFKHGHQMADAQVSPRTLKIAEVDGKNYVMGLAKIRERG